MKDGTFPVLLAALAVAHVAVYVNGLQATTLPAAASHDHTEEFDKLDDRLDKFTARLVKLEERIADRIDPARIRRAKSLQARVVKVEGTGCSKSQYQCGGNDPQCVSVLFVCDGNKDCRNGEDEKNCDSPVKAGDTFVGNFIFDKCTRRRPEHMTFEITSVQASTSFTSFIKVRANIGSNFQDDRFEGDVAAPTIGYYSFGTHKIVFNPAEDDRLGLTCEFDGANPDRCVGRIKQEASGDVCAKLIFVRKHD